MDLTQMSSAVVALVALLGAIRWLSQRLWHFAILSVHAFETIQKELNPNGGGSTYDLVRKVKAQNDLQDERLAAVEAKADTAVAEAKQGRAVMADAHKQNVAEIARTQGALEALTSQVLKASQDAHLKENAYVRALHRVGIDLTAVADAVLHEPSDPPP